MATQTTPSKQVCLNCHPPLRCRSGANMCPLQASSGLENLKMGDSPAKKLNFESVGKENVPVNAPAPIMNNLDMKKPITEVFDEKKKDKVAVAPTIKSLEADEPLLQENAHRFVLFPIKYHEVRVYATRCA